MTRPLGPTIRPVQPADLPQLVELCQAHAAYERAEYSPAGKAEALAGALFGPQPRLYLWVVERQPGKLAGFMALTLDYSTWDAAPFAHMDCLYLDESLRSQGVGKRLIELAAEFGRTNGCINLQWQTPTWNEGAIRFYVREGGVAREKQRFTLVL